MQIKIPYNKIIVHNHYCFSPDYTSVSALRWNLNLLSKYTNAIFASMSANRIPIQDRGPVPNGRKQYGLRFCFASFENL